MPPPDHPMWRQTSFQNANLLISDDNIATDYVFFRQQCGCFRACQVQLMIIPCFQPPFHKFQNRHGSPFPWQQAHMVRTEARVTITNCEMVF